MKQIIKLSTIMGMSGLNGHAALSAAAGLFRVQNIPFIAFVLIAGPGAILTATLLQGAIRERILAAMLAGILATLIIIVAAALGPKLFSILNLKILQIIGGISIGLIALMIIGLKIPEATPLIVMLLGFVVAFVWR